MVLIRLNYDIRDELRGGLNARYQPKRQTAASFNGGAWAQFVYDTLMAPHAEAVAAVHPALITKIGTFTVKGMAGVAKFPNNISVRFAGDGQPWPNKTTAAVMKDLFGDKLREFDGYYGAVLGDSPVWAGFKADAQAWIDRVNIANDEFSAATRSLNDLLEGAKTYAQALEMWPALWEITPQHIKDRHMMPDPKKSPPMVPTPDLSGLTQLTSELAKERITKGVQGK